MTAQTLLRKGFVVVAIVFITSFSVVEGASVDVKMIHIQRSQRRLPHTKIPSVFFFRPLTPQSSYQTRLTSFIGSINRDAINTRSQVTSCISRPFESCIHQKHLHSMLMSHRSLTNKRISSISKKTSAEVDEQAVYNELSALSQKIRALDESYYEGGASTTSDEEYDALARREADLCTRYPNLLLLLEEESGLGKEATRFGGRVGRYYKTVEESSVVKSTKKNKSSTRSGSTRKRQKRKHLENAPMQSLDNAMDTPEVLAWLNRVKKLLLSSSTVAVDSNDDVNTPEENIPIAIIAEPKIDGLSLSLRYELDEKQSNTTSTNFKFVWGATRGDGKQGEDVTEAVTSAWLEKKITDSDVKRFSVPSSFHFSVDKHPPPKILEIRGEVVLPQASFDEFALQMTHSDNKTALFSNARNAASGILLRSKEPISEEALEQTKWLQSRLQFYAYDIVASNPTNEDYPCNWLLSKFTENATKMRDTLSEIGFQVPNPVVNEEITISLGKDKDEADIPTLLDYHRNLLGDRGGAMPLPYHIDGVVYKLSSFVDRRTCGSSSRTPRWAIAHKFPPQVAVTRLNGIEVQVGRTGALTPVALLEPVDLGGVMVARASLHNFHYASKILLPNSKTNPPTTGYAVRKGVEVLVSRAGDVIPQVIKRIFDDDGSNTDEVISLEPPNSCPACGSPTTFGFAISTPRKKSKEADSEVDLEENEESESGQVLRCSGPQMLCHPRAVNAMAYAYSRAGLDIKGLSNSKLQHLMDENIIRYPADLFVAFGEKDSPPLVRHEMLSKMADLPGWGEISSQNVAESVRIAAEGVTLSRYIYSLGIKFIGTQASQLVARFFGDVDSFLTALENSSKYEIDSSFGNENVDDLPFGALAKVKGIGPVALSSLLSFAKDPLLMKVAKDLAKALHVQEESQPVAKSIGMENTNQPSLFQGMTVVFTGTLPGLSRASAQSAVKLLGAKATPNTVSKATTLVIEGEKGGKKAKQARDLGIHVMGYDEFLEMIHR